MKILKYLGTVIVIQKTKKPMLMKGLFNFKVIIGITMCFLFAPRLHAGVDDITKQVDSIKIIYDQKELRLPGESFGIGVLVYYKNGTVKKTWDLKKGIKPRLTFTMEVSGGIPIDNKIQISEKLLPSKGKFIKVKVWPNGAIQLAKEVLLPLNFEKKVEIVATSTLVKAPGYGFQFKVVSTFDNGTVREYAYSENNNFSDHFRWAANGGFFKMDSFYIESDLTKITNHTVNLTVYSRRNPDCFHSNDIQLDYAANYELTLNGISGQKGGRMGEDINDQRNTNGTNGEPGPDISVMADLFYDEILQKNLLYVFVQDLRTGDRYSYMITPEQGSITVTSNGGKGGDGANLDSAGGGNGGTGGNGGKIYLSITEDAKKYQPIILLYSKGGKGGNGGFNGFFDSGEENATVRQVGLIGTDGKNGDIVVDTTEDFAE